METYTTKDGFVFQIISYKRAETINKEVFILYNDDTQSLVTNASILEYAKKNGYKLGIEIGFLKDMKQKFVDLIKDFGTFNNWEGYVSMYFNQKQLREISKLLDIKFKDLKEMTMQQIKGIIS